MLKVLIIMALFWMAVGVTIFMQELAKELLMEEKDRKLSNLSLFQYLVVLGLSMLYGLFTPSKVLAYIKVKE